MPKVAIVLLSTTFFNFGIEIVKNRIADGTIDGYVALTRGLPIVDELLLSDRHCFKILSTNKFVDDYFNSKRHPDPLSLYSRASEFDCKYGSGSLARLILSDRTLSPLDSSSETAYYNESFHALSKSNPLHSILFALGLEHVFLEIFTSFDVSFAFCFSVSEIYSSYLDLLCCYYKVPFNHLDATRVANYYYLTNSRFSDGYPIHSLYYENKQPSLGSLEKGLTYLTEFREKPFYPEYEVSNRYYYCDFDLRKLATLFLKGSIQYFRSFFTSRIDYLQSARKFRDILSAFRTNYLFNSSLFTSPSALDGKKYVLFPLHVIPEKSTSIDAPLFTQHYAYLKDLVLSLPPDVYICVKEHIHMLGLRSIDFYKSILTLPRVYLVDPRPDIFPLINKSSGVACISSTTGLEGAFMNKPVLICSETNYSSLPYVFNYCKTGEFHEFLSYIEGSSEVDIDINTTGCVKFLAHVFDVSFPLNSSTLWKRSVPPHTLTIEEKQLASTMASRISVV
jgi:hypothetical protein